MKMNKKDLDSMENNKKTTKKKRAFTLIELLAVIIILGILMIIAIPSVTRYISDSRKSSYVDTIKELVGGARNFVNTGTVPMYNVDTTYYINYGCIKTENASKSPYGEFDKAYIIVTYDGKGFNYYFTGRDETGHGIKDIIKVDDLTEDSIETDIKSTDITTDVGIDEKETIVGIDSKCSIDSSFPSTSRYTVSENGGPRDGYVRVLGEYYFTLKEAIDHVPANNETEIEVFHNLKEGESIEIDNSKNILLKTNGFTIESTVERITGDEFGIKNYGTLNIEGNGTFKSDAVMFENVGVMNVDKGTYIEQNSNGFLNHSILNVSGATIKDYAESYPAIVNRDGGTTTLTNCHVEAGSNAVWNRDNSTTHINGGYYSSSNKTVISNDSIMTIDGTTIHTEGDNDRYSVYVGEIASLVMNNTNIEAYTGAVYGSQNTDIKITGGKIEGRSTYNLITIYGTATFSGNLVVKNKLTPIVVKETGSLTINSGNYNVYDSNVVVTFGILNIKNGTFTEDLYSDYPVLGLGAGSTTTIEGGTFESPSYSIYSQENTVENIKGGTFKATEDYCIYADGGEYTITGNPSFTNNGYVPTIYSYDATFNIKGGTISATRHNAIKNYGAMTISSGTIKSTANGYTTIVNQTGGNLTITGGTITSTAYALYNYATANISGGNLSSSQSHGIYNQQTLNISGTANISTTGQDKYGIMSYGSSANLTINGGTITSSNGPYAAFNSGGTATYVSGNCSPRNF